MLPSPKHTVSSFDGELQKLRDALVQMGGLAEAQLDAAIQVILRRDIGLADQVLETDAKIDRLDHEISAWVVRLLALRQPMGADLREIIAALKISADLERIGDYAANVAKRARALTEATPVRILQAIPRMGQLVQVIIKDVLDAYVERNAEKALEVWRADEQVDALYTSLFRDLLTYMAEDPRAITPCTHLLFIAKNVERIGDHATNIAETIHFMIKGDPLVAERPKGDTSSFAVIDGEEELPVTAMHNALVAEGER